MQAFISGFGISLSLILAIGAQNAFVLKQGIKREHVLAVCLICALSDAALIAAGVAGFGYLLERFAWIEPAARWGGFAFLLAYGTRSFLSAFRNSHELSAAGENAPTLARVALLTLAFTWLNPHVYLDTVVLIGSYSTKFTGQAALFGAGAMSASFVFFFTLGYGARLLVPLFRRPASWKVLEFIVGVIMFALAFALVLGG